MASEHYVEQLSPNSNGNGKHPQLLSPSYLMPPHESYRDGFELNPGWLFAVVRRRMAAIACVTIAVTSLVSLSTVSQAPEYQGSFRLLVEPISSKNDLLPLLTEAIRASANIPGSGASTDYDSLIDVLKSRQVSLPIVTQLQQKYPDISYDALINNLTIERNSTAKNKNTSKILEVSYRGSDFEKVKFVLDTISQSYLSYNHREQEGQIRQGNQFIKTQIPRVQKQVDQLEEQNMRMRQRYHLIDPETQGQQLAAQVAQVSGQRSQLQSQLNELRSLYTNTQRQLGLQQREATNAFSLSEAPRYQQLLNQLQDIDTKIATESARYSEDHPTVRDLREQRQNLLPLLNQESQRTLGPSGSNIATDPKTITFQSSLNKKLTQQLVDTAIQLKELETRYQALVQTEDRLNQQARQFPVISRQYSELQLKLDVATNNLKELLVKQKALQVEASQEVSPWELIDPVSISASPPDIGRSIGLGLILGLVLGVGVAFMLEELNNVFHTPEDIESETRLPLLGVIPFETELVSNPSLINSAFSTSPDSLKGNKNELQLSRDFPFLTAFRSLYANTHFLNSDQRIKSLVISSALPEEGKSTVAVYLALTAAEMGCRVLLVDANLRSPQAHNLLNLDNTRGLNEVVFSSVALEDAIQRSPLDNNLFFLSSGQSTTEPTKLLSSKQMQALTKQLQSAFDLVIYDSPSTMSLADSSFLAVNTDGIILVVQLGSTNRHSVKKALNSLNASRTSVLGVVANDYKKNKYSFHTPLFQNKVFQGSGLSRQKVAKEE